MHKHRVTVPALLLLLLAEAGDAMPSSSPFADSIPNTGLELHFNIAFAFLSGGNQNDPLVSPSPDNIDKMLTGIEVKYLFSKSFGLELAYDFYGGTQANASGYEPLNLYNDQVIRLGLVVEPVIRIVPKGMWKWEIGGGINYDFMKLHDDYADLVRQSGLTPFPGYANGPGFYIKTGFERVLRNGVTLGAGLGYENINPKFKDATRSMDASMIRLYGGIGYKFR